MLRHILTGTMAAYLALTPSTVGAEPKAEGKAGFFVYRGVGERAAKERAEEAKRAKEAEEKERAKDDSKARRDLRRLSRRAYNLRGMIRRNSDAIEALQRDTTGLTRKYDALQQDYARLSQAGTGRGTPDAGGAVTGISKKEWEGLTGRLKKFEGEVQAYHTKNDQTIRDIYRQLAGQAGQQALEGVVTHPLSPDSVTRGELESELEGYITEKTFLERMKEFADWVEAMKRVYGDIGQFGQKAQQFNEKLDKLESLARGIDKRLSAYDALRVYIDSLQENEDFNSFREVIERVYAEVASRRRTMEMTCEKALPNYLYAFESMFTSRESKKIGNKKIDKDSAQARGQLQALQKLPTLQEQAAQADAVVRRAKEQLRGREREIMQEAEKRWYAPCQDALDEYDVEHKRLREVMGRNLTDSPLSLEAGAGYLHNGASGVVAHGGFCAEATEHLKFCARLEGNYTDQQVAVTDKRSPSKPQQIGDNLFRTTTQVVDEEETGARYSGIGGSLRGLWKGRNRNVTVGSGLEVAVRRIHERSTGRTQASSVVHDADGTPRGQERLVPADGAAVDTRYNDVTTVIPSAVFELCYKRWCVEGSVGYDPQLEEMVKEVGVKYRF